MKQICILLIITGLLAAGCSSRHGDEEAETQGARATAQSEVTASGSVAGEAPVIIVNGHPITRHRIDWEIERQIGGVKSQMSPEQYSRIRAAARTNVTERLVEFLLLLNEAEARGTPAPMEELKSEYKRQKALAAFPQRMSFAQATNNPAYRHTIVANVKINRYLSEVVTNVEDVSEADIATFRAEHADTIAKLPEMAWARHILIGFDKGDTEEDKKEKLKQANIVRERILQGEDFAKLAAQYSTCPTRAIGGYLAAFPRGRMVPAFDKAAFSQPVGQVGPVVETSHGYHIIEVLKRVPAGTMDDDEIIAKIRQERNTEAVRKIVETLRQKATIVRNENL